MTGAPVPGADVERDAYTVVATLLAQLVSLTAWLQLLLYVPLVLRIQNCPVMAVSVSIYIQTPQLSTELHT